MESRSLTSSREDGLSVDFISAVNCLPRALTAKNHTATTAKKINPMKGAVAESVEKIISSPW